MYILQTSEERDMSEILTLWYVRDVISMLCKDGLQIKVIILSFSALLCINW